MERENRNKRIVIFSVAYYPFIGGAELAVKEVTDRIDEHDIEFDMVTLRFDRKLPTRERIGNINVYRIGFTNASPSMTDLVRFPLKFNKYLFPFIGFFKAHALNRTRRYGAAWSIMASYSGFATLFFKLAHPRTPFLLSLQEGDPIEYILKRVGGIIWLFKLIFIRATAVHAISKFLADFGKQMGYRGEPTIIPNAVDVRRFSQEPPSEALQELKQKLGKKADDVFLVTTSRFVPKNAIDDIVRALHELPSRFKLLILGIGPQERTVRHLTADLGLESRVIFLGYVEHRDIPPYLHISDIFVRPSRSEGMGSSFIEAMAAGLPVIATPVGGIVDFLFDPDVNPNRAPTGLFCRVRNPESIAKQVMRISDDAKLRTTIIDNARRLVSERYDWDLIAREMRERVFAKLLR